MGLFRKLTEGAADVFTLGGYSASQGDYSKALGMNVMTAIAKPTLEYGFKKAQDKYRDYQYKNGGKAAEEEMRKSQEAANLSASQQAADELKKNSSLAASRYAFGGSGGSNLQSFTNKGQTKKSILGSF